MKNLIILLEKQQNSLASLSDLLESELHMISSRDAEALTKILNGKSEVLDTISDTDRAIETAFEKLDGAEDDPKVIELLGKLRSALSQCKFRTEINQKAVEQGQLRLEHLRSLMLETRAKETMTYDKGGKPRGGSSSKSISA